MFKNFFDQNFRGYAKLSYRGPNIKKLKGKLSNLYRYRIGGFSILYEIIEDIKTFSSKGFLCRGFSVSPFIRKVMKIKNKKMRNL